MSVRLRESRILHMIVSRKLIQRNVLFREGKNIQMESNKSARMHAAGKGEAEAGGGGGQMLLTFLPIPPVHRFFRGRLRPFGPFEASRPPILHSEYLTRAFVSIHVCVPLQNRVPNAHPILTFVPQFGLFGSELINKPY